ncbi:hypothetical protein Q7P36_005105 [Cladosporium allicinum]
MLMVCNAGKPKPGHLILAAVRKCPGGPVPDWEHLKSLLREARATTCYWGLHTNDQLQRHHDSRDIIREAHCAPELPHRITLAPYRATTATTMSQFVGKTRLAYSRAWHLVDAGSDPRPLGRLASSIALTLMGKHKPIYDPSTDCGDYVVCTGLSQLHTTGKKMQKKKYYSHTTRPGSLKEITMERMMEKWGGGEILRRAVRGMLPKNRLRDDRMARLKCFEGHAHPYKQNILQLEGQQSSILDLPEVKTTMEKVAPSPAAASS